MRKGREMAGLEEIWMGKCHGNLGLDRGHVLDGMRWVPSYTPPPHPRLVQKNKNEKLPEIMFLWLVLTGLKSAF